MTAKYDICFAGDLLENQDRETVRAGLAKLFKADEATLDRLFSGKLQLLKRGCDKDTAVKYKAAIERAGAKPIIRKSAEETPTPEPSPPVRKMTAAERIAALAAAPDVESGKVPAAQTQATAPEKAQATTNAPEQAQVPVSAAAQTSAPDSIMDSGISLSPAGSDVLRPEERVHEESVDIDVSALVLSETGTSLAAPSEPPPPAPDTGHLTLGEVGETIPTLKDSTAPLSPDISAIDLAPENSDFSDCARLPAAAPDVDLSSLNLAPSGADMLEENYRQHEETQAPSTDHLELED